MMANDIVKMVAQKANISESIAQVAVDTVLNFVKDKLPGGLGNTLDSFLGSDNSGSNTAASKNRSKSDNPLGNLGNIVSTIGGLFGKK